MRLTSFLVSAASTSAAANPNLLQCRNFGCTQKFEEAENSDTACRHHQAPPTFHDLKKGWQCCSTKMVYDWDEFERIEPCAVGRHSAVAPTAQFAQSPTVAAAEGAAAGAVAPAPAPVAAPVLKSIDDYNKTNPNAVTAVSAAVDTQKAYVSHWLVYPLLYSLLTCVCSRPVDLRLRVRTARPAA